MQVLVYTIYTLIATVWLLRLWRSVNDWRTRFKIFLYSFLLIACSKLIGISITNPILWFGLFQRIGLEQIKDNFPTKDWVLSPLTWFIIVIFGGKVIELIYRVNEIHFWYLHGLLTGIVVSWVGFQFAQEAIFRTLLGHGDNPDR